MARPERRAAGRDPREPQSGRSARPRARRAALAGQIEAADAGRESLCDATESWWTEHVEPNLAHNTILGYANVLDRHLLPRLGETPIRDIDPARVMELQR